MSTRETARDSGSVRPFLKWAGGKQALADKLVGYFPDDFAVYFEPFLGGGSVFFELQPKHAVLADQNEWLVETYRVIAEDWRAVARVLDTLPNTPDDYARIRRTRLSTVDGLTRAAIFVYLNKTCFRGLFRVNRRGEFNVPYGNYQRRYFDPDNLHAVAASLADARLRCADFEFGLDGITDRDFAYLDPPYYKLGGYSDFNRYTPSQFRERDHYRLAAVCRELDARGVRWAQTNSSTPFVRTLYSGFRITVLDTRREINLSSRDRNCSELLIRNY